MTALNRSLYLGAATTLALDGLAYLALIVPGRAVELNPLIAPVDPLSALAAKACLVFYLGMLVLALPGSRLVTAVLGVAVCAGLLGFLTTVIAVIAA